MSRSSARRAQVEPLAALAAVLVLGVGLWLYADALAAVEPSPSGPAVAQSTLGRVHDAVVEDGAADPDRLAHATAAGPAGHDLNVTLAAGDRRWTTGPVPPSDAPSADRRTAVRVDRWSAPPGRLRVVVWS